MFSLKKFQFILINLIFTLSYLILSFQYIILSGLAFKALLIVLAFLNAFLLLFTKKTRIGAMFILVALTSIYFGVQTVFFRSFNQYGMITTALSVQSNMFKFVGSALEFMRVADVIYFTVPFIALYIGIKLYKKNYVLTSPFHQSLIILLLITLGYTQYSTFHKELDASQSNPINLVDSSVVYANIPNTNVFVAQFGLNGLLLREFDMTIEPIEVQAELTIEQQISALLNQKTAPVRSDYSGIFEGLNVLLIEAESLNNLAIDPELTPTLYRLKHSGLFVRGYNSPLLAGSTSDTEFMVNTSLLPSNNGKITFNAFAENSYPLTLAKSFTDKGYFSMASHNNYGVYYNRSVMLPNLGYTFYDALGLNAYDNVEDSYVIDHIKWIMYEYENYFSFWITYNGHQPYSMDTLNETMLKYYDVVNKRYPDMPEAEKIYFAKNMDLDKGLSDLLKDYENNDLLKDLVIIIYGDHFPKGLFENKEDYRTMCEANGIEYNICFNTPFIIWHNDEIMGNIDKVSSPLDIAPTIYDLFNIEYPYQLALGHSVFDPSYTGFNFNEFGVIKSNDFTFDTLRGTITHNWTKTEEEFRVEADALYAKLQLGFKIVETDYFNSLEYKKGSLGE
ncbi:MAG TPA: LTA synthase family protein [Erysipelotrichaceae bacterium]|nr:LTA synthase family protein [Erysipelotrichaceae bacterium]